MIKNIFINKSIQSATTLFEVINSVKIGAVFSDFWFGCDRKCKRCNQVCNILRLLQLCQSFLNVSVKHLFAREWWKVDDLSVYLWPVLNSVSLVLGWIVIPIWFHVGREQSVEQISSRADRLNISAHELFLYSATDLEVHIAHHHAWTVVNLFLRIWNRCLCEVLTGSTKLTILVQSVLAASWRKCMKLNRWRCDGLSILLVNCHPSSCNYSSQSMVILICQFKRI